MKYIYTQEFFGITNVKMEFYDVQGNSHCKNLEYDKKKHYWFCEFKEDVMRYKFIVNDIIRLNDPYAKQYVLDSKQEVWSVQGKGVEEVPKLKAYYVSNIVEQGITGYIKKMVYVYDRPVDIYVGTSIQHVNEIHSLTYICFQPDGRIYKLEECCIGQVSQNADYEVVFKNHIERIPSSIAEGMWAFQVYLDGQCIMKDYFVLKKKVINNNILLNYKI